MLRVCLKLLEALSPVQGQTDLRRRSGRGRASGRHASAHECRKRNAPGLHGRAAGEDVDHRPLESKRARTAAVLCSHGRACRNARGVGDQRKHVAPVLAMTGAAVHELDAPVSAEDRRQPGDDRAHLITAPGRNGVSVEAFASAAETDACRARSPVAMKAKQKYRTGARRSDDIADQLLQAIAGAADHVRRTAGTPNVTSFEFVKAWVKDIDAIGDLQAGSAGDHSRPCALADDAVDAQALVALEFTNRPRCFGAIVTVTAYVRVDSRLKQPLQNGDRR